jgi:hypothetical protein
MEFLFYHLRVSRVLENFITSSTGKSNHNHFTPPRPQIRRFSSDKEKRFSLRGEKLIRKIAALRRGDKLNSSSFPSAGASFVSIIAYNRMRAVPSAQKRRCARGIVANWSTERIWCLCYFLFTPDSLAVCSFGFISRLASHAIRVCVHYARIVCDK